MNDRIRFLREKLRGRKIEGMIVSNPANIKYLTGIGSAEGVLLITRKENIYLTHTMFIEDVHSVLTINDEVIVMDYKDITKEEYENFFLFCENVGFEENHITYENYKRIKQKYKAHNLVETEKIIENQRIIKSDEEIEYIKKASEITDKCFAHLLKYIKKDMTEREVALEIERFFKTNEADGTAFSPIVAFGENTSKPHHVPTNKKVQTADPILIDMGCSYKGYCSDMTRTIFMGCILEEIKPVYDLVRKTQTMAIQDAKENNNIKAIVKSAENSIEFNKYRTMHTLGHGVGLETHELPILRPTNENLLKENMIITIEPGVYLPGKYGIRIEDTVLITKTGNKELTTSGKGYTVI
ncbi:MAG: Xaa-Pro peptidase family protein [Oscillospiraceae bacterium]|nr:Xaa-Pro peptidase family protein [Oscillospiraceae bacterium]